MKGENYLYTEHFTQDSFVDFGIQDLVPIFSPGADPSRVVFESTIKRHLKDGPLMVDIHVDPTHTLSGAGILNIFNFLPGWGRWG